MTDPIDAMLQSVYATAKGASHQLGDDGLEEARQIFDETVGAFLQRYGAQVDFWADAQFRNFILKISGDIGVKALQLHGQGSSGQGSSGGAGSPSGNVTPDELRRAAFDVMDQNNTECRKVLKRWFRGGKIFDDPTPGHESADGLLCAAFLAQHTSNA
jgi:hypothetical protein